MAMLAEPRRKQRIGPNPRGKFFMEDDSNSGKQLLEKMGWKQGDGLGLQKQGMVEPVKPKVQMTNKGVGYNIRSDPWIDHSNDFADILRKLNEDNSVGLVGNETAEDVVPMPNKLENKSKSSRARIHYHKFVKGKDLSRASSKDLESIFGTTYNKAKQDTLFLEDPDSSSADSKLKEGDMVVDEDSKNINRGSMHDYFAKKMEQRKLKLVDQSEDVEIDLGETKKKRKKRNRSPAPEEAESNVELESKDVPVIPDTFEDGLDPNVNVDLDLKSEGTEAKNKKKKRRNKSPSPDLDLQADIEIITDSNTTLELETAFDDNSTEVVTKKKSKKKKKYLENASSESTVLIPEIESKTIEERSKFVSKGSMVDYFARKMEDLRLKQLNNNKSTVEPKPKVENESNANHNTESSLNEIPEEPILNKKSKKRKKCPDLDSTPSFEVNSEEIGPIDEQVSVSVDGTEIEKVKKKKRKKNRDLISETVEVTECSDLIAPTAVSESEDLKLTNNDTETGTSEVSNEYHSKSTKDKKRRRAVSPESMKKLSKQFKGSNLNKINGYALY